MRRKYGVNIKFNTTTIWFKINNAIQIKIPNKLIYQIFTLLTCYAFTASNIYFRHKEGLSYLVKWSCVNYAIDSPPYTQHLFTKRCSSYFCKSTHKNRHIEFHPILVCKLVSPIIFQFHRLWKEVCNLAT